MTIYLSPVSISDITAYQASNHSIRSWLSPRPDSMILGLISSIIPMLHQFYSIRLHARRVATNVDDRASDDVGITCMHG